MSTETELYKADKITVAGCQLDTSIELIFGLKDVISAAVLIHSAWSVIKDLLKHKGIESSRSWMTEFFPDTPEKDVWKTLDEVWNFCKHAQKKDEVDKLIQFPVGYIETVLFLALYDFSQISTIKSKTMDVYELWFISKHEETFKDHDVFKYASELFPGLANLSREQQARCGFEALSKII